MHKKAARELESLRVGENYRQNHNSSLKKIALIWFYDSSSLAEAD